MYRTTSSDLTAALSERVKGQAEAIRQIAPYVQMYETGLAPEGRPAGIFLLLGPTGTGKTRTVEALAEVLHGDRKKVLKIDCGEFQLDHEVAKLIGAPPGYLGHRETHPLLTTQALNAAASAGCDLSLVLFDEIEKAAPPLARLLLGVLDKGTLRLGDNSTVNFEKSLVFFTSNLGATEMTKALAPGLGFHASAPPDAARLEGQLRTIGLAAARKRFSPEFFNRIDAVITYQPLDADSLAEIVDQHLSALQQQVRGRLGERSFEIAVSAEARAFLVERGTSPRYGARELKRAIHRELTQPLASLVSSGEVEPGARVVVDAGAGGAGLSLEVEARRRSRAA
ncbi:MAG: ATP-dependent Clp protease ATP-binding subunit [Candidatus Solibacter usitatus]|nr:ATP-dependent Clp protease ATP-binding subunit [Candidatus Solibacter usitatus]